MAAMIALTTIAIPLAEGQIRTYEVASRLVALKTSVLQEGETEAAKTMMLDDLLVRTRAANERQFAAVEKIRARAAREQFRDERLAAMIRSFR